MNEPEPLLFAPFGGAELPAQLHWHNEPKRWSLDGAAGVLRVEPDAPTDFWQRTHYGFRTDNGHFLYQEVLGDFVLTVHASFHPVHQYDQAGLMVRVSPDCWLKSSVEFEPDGPSRLGAVVTNYGYSDWSTQDFSPTARAIWLRVCREGNDYLVEASSDGQRWSPIRMAHLHEGHDAAVKCGVYACSPKGVGFAAEFSSFSIDAGRVQRRRSKE